MKPGPLARRPGGLRPGGRWSLALLGLLLLALPVSQPRSQEGGSGASGFASRDYAFLMLQGKVYGPHGHEPLSGVTVHLHAAGDSYQAVTDERGIFLFDKLPVQAYQVRVRSTSGRSIRSVVRMGADAPIRLKVGTGKGQGAEFRVRPDQAGIAVDLPRQPARWKKFWTEVAIIGGVALLFAL